MSNKLRSIRRNVVGNAMKIVGCVNINKPKYGTSFFAEHWKEASFKSNKEEKINESEQK